MKIAITGGAGFIGTHLTKAYLDAGHDVVVIDSLAHGSRQAIDPRARFYRVDIRDEKLRTILQQERPEIVSHHAAQQDTSPIQRALTDADVHVRGLLNVLDSCVSAAVKRLIFASGGNSLYGDVAANQLPLAEDTPLSPESAHDISKAAGEWYVRHYTQQFGLNHTILRYADVYGEHESIHSRHPLNYFITMLFTPRRPIIRGTGNEVRDHIFIDDVIQANLLALKRAENQTLHISSGQGYSLNQLYDTIAHITGSKIEPIYLSGAAQEKTACILDNTRARECLYWAPAVSVPEGIWRIVAKLRDAQAPVTPRNEIVNTPQTALAVEAKLSRV